MCNQCCCCYSKPILDVADNKFAESAAVLMLKHTVFTYFNTYLHINICQENIILQLWR